MVKGLEYIGPGFTHDSQSGHSVFLAVLWMLGGLHCFPEEMLSTPKCRTVHSRNSDSPYKTCDIAK